MHESSELLGLYLRLAWASWKRRRPLVRDKLLVLAASEACRLELPLIAAHCRQLVLEHNPGHLVGHFATVEQALGDEGFNLHLARLQRHYSREKSEHILASLGLTQANERAAYYSDEEFAAALLGTTVEALRQRYAEASTEDDGATSAAPVMPERSNNGASTDSESARRKPTVGWWLSILLLGATLLIVAVWWWLTVTK